ncbi:hypothetical protein PG985_000087 [Apiospora marii]|uniref:uncharacterized protein n=1 Tax=Apiospora marii TaxID=335849 RepID=UPI00312DC972
MWTVSSVTVESSGSIYVTVMSSTAGGFNAYGVQLRRGATDTTSTQTQTSTSTAAFTTSTSTSGPTPTESISPSSGLTTGAAIGIGVGCTFAGISIVAAVAFLFFRKRGTQNRPAAAEIPMHPQLKGELPADHISAPFNAPFPYQHSEHPVHEIDTMPRRVPELPG